MSQSSVCKWDKYILFSTLGILTPSGNSAAPGFSSDLFCREIIASAAAMAGFAVPRHEIDHDKHGYVPQAPVALGTTQEMLGPIYDVMQQHNYGQVGGLSSSLKILMPLVQINTIVNELNTLTTPVYTPESKNHYQNILK